MFCETPYRLFAILQWMMSELHIQEKRLLHLLHWVIIFPWRHWLSVKFVLSCFSFQVFQKVFSVSDSSDGSALPQCPILLLNTIRNPLQSYATCCYIR